MVGSQRIPAAPRTCRQSRAERVHFGPFWIELKRSGQESIDLAPLSVGGRNLCQRQQRERRLRIVFMGPREEIAGLVKA